MKKNRVTSFIMKEISMVRRPAQEGALIGIIKSADDLVIAELAKALSSEERTALPDSAFFYVKGDVRKLPYRHADGSVDQKHLRLASQLLGDTHDIPDAEKASIRSRINGLLQKDAGPAAPAGDPAGAGSPGVNDVHVPCIACGSTTSKKTSKHCADCGALMMKEIPMAMTDQEKAHVADLEANLAKSQKFGLLSDIEKAHYSRLSSADQVSFLAKSATERAEETKPVYTCVTTGAVFTKADDSRNVDMAKALDASIAANKVELEKAQNATWLAKADVDLKHLPGTVEERAALLKSIAMIPDEKVREAALANLKAHDATLAKGMTRQGTGGSLKIVKGGSAQERLDAAAQKFADDHKIPLTKAWDQFAETAEAGALYAEVDAELKAEQK